MIRKATLGTIAVMALLAGSAQQPAQAQSTAPKPVVCNYAWCPIQVEVVKNSSGADVLRVSFDQIRMAQKYSTATLIWKLLGSPDYEFRADSVTAKGANAGSAAAQFPPRMISANEFAFDNLNNNNLTYDYEIRVYKKGSPAGSAPITSSGTIVNSAS